MTQISVTFRYFGSFNTVYDFEDQVRGDSFTYGFGPNNPRRTRTIGASNAGFGSVLYRVQGSGNSWTARSGISNGDEIILS